MNNAIVPFNFDGRPVRFNSDGWIDAASAAKCFNKEPTAWLRSLETLEYMSALADALFGKPVSETELEKLRAMNSRGRESKALTLKLAKETGLITTKAGRGGGTWLHPKLAVGFARWLNVKFAVWADLHIDALLHGELNEMQQFERACRVLSDAEQVASLSGSALARFRYTKPRLVREVDHWREQLQMTLGLEAA